jgi:parallel beta-helix repeat protein
MFLIGCKVVVRASPTTIYVPTDYPTIQEAIDHADEGDTILVHNGKYYENVLINKTLTLIGEERKTTIIDAMGVGNVVFMQGDNIVMSNFTFENCGSSSGPVPESVNCGIRLEKATDSTVRNSIFLNDSTAIFLIDSTNNVILGNSLSDCGDGIWEYNYPPADNNTIAKNIVQNCGVGINCWSSGNNLTDNVIIDNTFLGVDLYYPGPNNMLRNNTIDNNSYNFGMEGYELSSFIQDIDSSNVVNGKPICYIKNSQNQRVPEGSGFVALVNCTNMTVQGQNLERNFEGLILAYTQSSSVLENNITANLYGISVPFSSFDKVFHNNIASVYDNVEGGFGENNIWDDGYPSGGNYWNFSAPDSFTGPFQNESGSDGIIDGGYRFADNYPLAGMFTNYNATSEYSIQTICNSTVSNFQFNQTSETVRFNVTGEDGTSGFCRICIPTRLMEAPYVVSFDGKLIDSTELPSSNSTYSFLYFTYVQSTHQVAVVPRDVYLYYDLLDKYNVLLNDYSSLQGNYILLETTSNNLIANFISLRAAYNILSVALAQNSSDFSSKYQMLNSSYINLSASFTNLNQSYINLNQSFNDYKTSTQDDLSNTRNLVYALVAITIILAVAIIYLVIRKPMKPEATHSAK